MKSRFMTNYCCTEFGRKVNHGKYWSQTEKSYMYRALRAGKSTFSIARDLGRSRNSVLAQMNNMGVL